MKYPRTKTRPVCLALIGFGALPGVAHAADKLAFGPPPAWVVPTALPSNQGKSGDAAVAILLNDAQLRFTPQADEYYTENAVRIQTPQGLDAMGTLSVVWNPDADTVTIHRLRILRGSQVIDVLASGQDFTVLRRETNLQQATLDGTLTAAIQPGGLQVGDIVDFAYTISDSDPVFHGISEWSVVLEGEAPVARLRMRAQWPSALPMRWRPSTAATGAREETKGDTHIVSFALDGAQPLPQVNDAPARYARVRRIDFTQFASWPALSMQFAPLYAKAATLKPQSPLLAEIARIRAANPTPKARAGAALALVQDQVHYVFLGMHDGGLIPANADLTWVRRFGDCKGKTALLLALLHGLDLAADPVVVSSFAGDGLNARLPLISEFNHVLVRARIDGQTYWLDGTRTGDRRIEEIAVPAFIWGLPLTIGGSDLVPITPQPLSQPSTTEAIRIDARAGLYASLPIHGEVTLRGDAATALRIRFANAPPSDVDQYLRRIWSEEYRFVDLTGVNAAFDAAAGVERLTMDGTTRLEVGGRFIRTDGLVPTSLPNFTRQPGPDQDAPFAVPFPSFVRYTETIQLPDSAAGYAVRGSDVNQIIGGVEYKRTARIDHGSFVGELSTRSVAPEFPAAQAAAATRDLRDLMQSAVFVQTPTKYAPSQQDLGTLAGRPLSSANQHLARGNYLLDQRDYDDALADFNAAVALDPRSAVALADRGLTYVWKGDLRHASQDLAAASALDKSNPVIFRARGLMDLNAGQARSAIAAFNKSLELDPNNIFALQRLAAAYIDAGDDESALTVLVTLENLRPELPGVYAARAAIYRRRGMSAQAVTQAGVAIARASSNPRAYVVAAEIYDDLQRHDDAMRAFDQALQIKPEVATYLARARRRPASDTAGARADVEAALKLDPHAKDALMLLARMQSNAGDHTGAATTLSTAIAAHPNDPALLTLRGTEYIKAHAQDLADKDFAAARSAAKSATDDNTLCWFKATAGVALAGALQDCQAALAKQPGSAIYLDSEAFVMLRLGRYGDAIDLYTQALRARPASSDSLFGRAMAERHRGDAKNAANDFATAHNEDPEVERRYSEFGVVP